MTCNNNSKDLYYNKTAKLIGGGKNTHTNLQVDY